MKIRLADYVADFLVAHGPVWIDIPVDFQGCYIDTDSLAGYDSTEDESPLYVGRAGNMGAKEQHKALSGWLAG